MSYCYQCGSVLENLIPPNDDREREMCAACGYVHYVNPRVLVGVHLYHKDKILWTKRGIEPNVGKWSIPGGFLEQGETLQEAAARELSEETRIVVAAEKMKPFGMLSLLVMDQVYLSFRCQCDDFLPAQLTQETVDWGWYSEEEAPWAEVAYANTIEQARQTYRMLREGKFPMRVGHISREGVNYKIYSSDA